MKVWWFGGTDEATSQDDESCELVAVRIDRTSPNSRRIGGEITVPARLEDVWSILTDYDRLSIHVPNLMESRVTQRNSQGQPGDGTFKCRLFQKGAQKIIGFDFSASVTMDMTEQVFPSNSRSRTQADPDSLIPEDRVINFKCVESQFFSEFDGQWKVQEILEPDGTIATTCSYTVDVRPKGPVPVAALEWRIREDVPTNLRAVKAATLRINAPNTLPLSTRASVSQQQSSAQRALGKQMAPVLVDWDRDETLAKYL